MPLLETILITWFFGGLLAVALISLRGVVHDLWCRVTGRRDGRPSRTHGGGGGRSHHTPVRDAGR